VSYRWVEHTAEVELHIEERTPELIFQTANRAFKELVGGGSGPEEVQIVQLEEPDTGALLVRWLEELVFLADTQGFVVDEANILYWSPTVVSAELIGHLGEPRPLVKAVTYHGLEFGPAEGGWRAKVVLDV
jgi:SHS2 domain-containing protein